MRSERISVGRLMTVLGHADAIWDLSWRLSGSIADHRSVTRLGRLPASHVLISHYCLFSLPDWCSLTELDSLVRPSTVSNGASSSLAMASFLMKNTRIDMVKGVSTWVGVQDNVAVPLPRITHVTI
jgi:hypothetical protein